MGPLGQSQGHHRSGDSMAPRFRAHSLKEHLQRARDVLLCTNTETFTEELKFGLKSSASSSSSSTSRRITMPQVANRYGFRGVGLIRV